MKMKSTWFLFMSFNRPTCSQYGELFDPNVMHKNTTK